MPNLTPIEKYNLSKNVVVVNCSECRFADVCEAYKTTKQPAEDKENNDG